eukprot:108813-Pyramimonas_sp.AAC.1
MSPNRQTSPFEQANLCFVRSRGRTVSTHHAAGEQPQRTRWQAATTGTLLTVFERRGDENSSTSTPSMPAIFSSISPSTAVGTTSTPCHDTFRPYYDLNEQPADVQQRPGRGGCDSSHDDSDVDDDEQPSSPHTPLVADEKPKRTKDGRVGGSSSSYGDTCPVSTNKEEDEFGGPAGVCLIMLFSHLLVLYIWLCNEYFDGAAVGITGLLHPPAPWSHILARVTPTMRTHVIYLSFLLFQVACAVWLPGVTGTQVPSKHQVKLAQ